MRPALRSRVCLVLLALGWPAFASAQPRTVVVPGQRQWTIGGWWRQAHGLPQDRVTVLKQTRDGYLWIGTRNGIGRFDGESFSTWEAGTPRTLPEGEVYSIAEHPAGGLWLTVYGGGLVRYDGSRFATISAADGLADNYARAVAVGRDGAVWVGTDRGLSRLLEGRFTRFLSGDGPASDAIRTVFIDADGAVFAGAERGLYRVAGNALVRVPLPGAAHEATVETILRDRPGRLWVGTSNGLVRLDGGRSEVLGPAAGVSASAIRHVYEDSAGRIWVATLRGVDCADPHDAGGFRFASVVSGADATAILEDREGSVWVGFRGHGLVRLQRSLFTVYDAAHGLPSDSSSTVFQSRTGAVWMGVGNGLSVLQDGALTNFGVGDGLPDRPVSALTEDESRRLWVGTETGLFKSVDPVRCGQGRCAARFAAVVGHPALRDHIRVLRAGVGVMLTGTNSSGVLAVPLAAGAPVTHVVDGEIRAILRESAERFWVGTRDLGLFLVTPAGVVRYSTAEGLPHVTVQCLYAGADGTIWIGTRRGLAWLREGRISSVTSADGLHQNHVYGITADATGRLWLSSGNGVSTVTPGELYDVAARRRTRLMPTLLGTEHGLPTTLCALSHDPVIMTDARGLVWVTTLGGVVNIDPRTIPPEPGPPRVLIETVTLETQQIAPGASADALHERGSVLVHYTAPAFVTPERIRYRYRLREFDPGWTDAKRVKDARFTNVPPGRYVFEVSAAVGNGDWGTPVTLDVQLRPRLYQRSWFKGVAAFGGLGIVVASTFVFFKIRERRLKAREQELARSVEEALAQVKVLKGFLPTCAWCKRVRDENGAWTQMELYVRAHSQAEFSHGLCPDCMTRNFPDEAASLAATPPDAPASGRGV
jgi:ligand-binding sensor domain-containing protein